MKPWKGKLKRLREEKERTGMSFFQQVDNDYANWKAERIGKLLDTQQKLQEKMAARKEKKELAQRQLEKIKTLEKQAHVRKR